MLTKTVVLTSIPRVTYRDRLATIQMIIITKNTVQTVFPKTK